MEACLGYPNLLLICLISTREAVMSSRCRRMPIGCWEKPAGSSSALAFSSSWGFSMLMISAALCYKKRYITFELQCQTWLQDHECTLTKPCRMDNVYFFCRVTPNWRSGKKLCGPCGSLYASKFIGPGTKTVLLLTLARGIKIKSITASSDPHKMSAQQQYDPKPLERLKPLVSCYKTTQILLKLSSIGNTLWLNQVNQAPFWPFKQLVFKSDNHVYKSDSRIVLVTQQQGAAEHWSKHEGWLSLSHRKVLSHWQHY